MVPMLRCDSVTVMEPIDKLRFGEIAVVEDLISPTDLNESLRLQEDGRASGGEWRHKLGTQLVRRGLISREDAQRVLAIYDEALV